MFQALKKKLSGWLKSSTEKVKELVSTPSQVAKKEKKPKKARIKKEKPVKKRKLREEIKQERKITEKILADIKQEQLEIKTPEERLEEIKEVKEEKKSFFSRLLGRISEFKINEEYFNEIFSELELVLLENNVALSVIDKIKIDLQKKLIGKEIKKQELETKIKNALKTAILNILQEPFNLIEKIKNKSGVFVILFFGINGSGKTTTIAKLASLLKKNNISCILAAGDTFRAASIEQLQEHGSRLGIEVIKSQYHADPSSVAFDAIKHAQSRAIKAVLIDTAGRMHTKSSLLSEMEKIVRVSKPDLKLFIAESITGNDAVEQAKTFNETIGIDGIILSKADVDEKAGTILSVSHVTGKPILYLGVGQSYQDLELFDKNKVISSLGL